MNFSLLHYLASSARELLLLAANEAVFAILIFLEVFLLTRLFRNRFPHLHYALWSLIFLRLILPPSMSHPLSAAHLISGWMEPGLTTVYSQNPHVQGFSYPPADLAETPTSVVMEPDVPWWALFLIALWVCGTAMWAFRFGRRLSGFRRLLRNAHPVNDEMILATAEGWRLRLGIRRSVRVLTSPAAVLPFTDGSLRPMIFIPKAILDLNKPVIIESVLAHEMAHIARWDSFWRKLQHVIHGLYFFHPAVWYSSSRLDEAREQLCDALVLARSSLCPKTYAGSILDVLRLNLQRVEASSLGNGNRRLSMRIKAILGNRKPLLPHSVLIVILIVFFGVFMLPLSARDSEKEALEDSNQAYPVPEPSPPPPEPSPSPPKPPLPFQPMELAPPLPMGRISSAYGEMRDPFTQKIVFHKGMDIVAKRSTPIVAPADGKVEIAQTGYIWRGHDFGTVILLDHGNGWNTFYAHLRSFEVTEGQRVARGEVIARVGSTGRSTGPHLHFEVRHDGEPLNPEAFIKIR